MIINYFLVLFKQIIKIKMEIEMEMELELEQEFQLKLNLETKIEPTQQITKKNVEELYIVREINENGLLSFILNFIYEEENGLTYQSLECVNQIMKWNITNGITNETMNITSKKVKKDYIKLIKETINKLNYLLNQDEQEPDPPQEKNIILLIIQNLKIFIKNHNNVNLLPTELLIINNGTKNIIERINYARTQEERDELEIKRDIRLNVLRIIFNLIYTIMKYPNIY